MKTLQSALDSLKMYIDDHEGEGMNELKDIYNEFASVEAEKWLKYPENKPVENTHVLTTTESGNQEVAYFDELGWSYNMRHKTIIAFRELPKPYQPKQEGGEV